MRGPLAPTHQNLDTLACEDGVRGRRARAACGRGRRAGGDGVRGRRAGTAGTAGQRDERGDEVRKIATVDVLDDTTTQKKVLRWSLALLAPGVAGLVAALVFGWGENLGIWWVVAFLAGYALSLPVHELVHGALFKLLGPRGTRVRFGYAKGMLYATCPGTRLPRGSFMAVLLGPLVVLTVVYVVLGVCLGTPLLAWALVWAHASGCAGDLLFLWTIVRTPQADLVEDTSVGMVLWDDSDCEGDGGHD